MVLLYYILVAFPSYRAATPQQLAPNAISPVAVEVSTISKTTHTLLNEFPLF